MTNPIELLEHRLIEIKQAEALCRQSYNLNDLQEINRQKQMYVASVNYLKTLF